MLISLVVLAVALVVAAVGYYLGAYRPAHQAVLTVGSERMMASEIEARALYLLLYQQTLGPRSADELITKSLDVIEREGMLRQRAPALVGEVSGDDLAKDLTFRLATPYPTAVPTPTPTRTPTPTATPESTPVADAKQVAETQQERLLKSGLSKSAFDALTRAQILEDRLRDRFKKEAPSVTLQWEVQVAIMATQERADQLREIVQRPGVNFAHVAGAAGTDNANGELAWVLPELQEQAIRDTVSKLKPGEVSAPIKSGTRFLVYRFSQIDERREVTDDHRDQIAKDRLDKWYAEARKQLTIQRDLPSNREETIRARVIAAYQKANPPVQRGG